MHTLSSCSVATTSFFNEPRISSSVCVGSFSLTALSKLPTWAFTSFASILVTGHEDLISEGVGVCVWVGGWVIVSGRVCWSRLGVNEWGREQELCFFFAVGG